MSDASDASRDSTAPPSMGSMPGGRERPIRARRRVLERVASLGASAQAAIPGLYAWAITVAPAAWSRGAPLFAKGAAVVGLLAIATAPLVERAPPSPLRPWTGPKWARIWSVWGFVLSSAV